MLQRELKQPRWLAPALFVSVFGLALLYTPRAEVAAAQSGSPFAFAADLNTEPWRFSPGELQWLSSDGPLSAGRWRFDWQGHTGSLLVITSSTWRAHHRPERCFESYGLTVNQSYSRLLEPDFPLRVVLLSAPGQRHRYSAVYWLQAPGSVTDDYATRIWSDLSPGNQTWSLVTVLFDAPIEPLDGELAGLYAELRRTVEAGLNGNEGWSHDDQQRMDTNPPRTVLAGALGQWPVLGLEPDLPGVYGAGFLHRA